MSVAQSGGLAEVRYFIEPNRSMGRREARWMVAGVAGVSFLIAGTLALRYGAWPILPFAGMEVALLAFVISRVQMAVQDQEVLVLGESFVDLTRRHGREIDSFRFNRHWVRVKLCESGARNLHNRLEIGSHGKFVEIGSFLTDEERVSLAQNLTARLNRAKVEEFLKPVGDPEK